MPRITPFLWFDGRAEEAADYYTSIFPNSRKGRVALYSEGSPGGTAGTVMTVEFSLDGQDFTALNGGPVFHFTEATSFVVHCADQAEVDHYWDKLSAGGEPSVCGWLKDRFGVSWQIVPAVLLEMLQHPDVSKRTRLMQAVLQMKKPDIAKLQAAFEG